MSSVHRWKLYVDESGAFAKEERVAVAGVLLSDTPPELCDVDLGDSLKRDFPEIPWPLHAAHLRQPLCYLIWHRAAGQNPDTCQPLTGAEAEVCEQLWGELSPHQQALLQAEIDALCSRGRRPDLSVLWKLWDDGVGSREVRQRVEAIPRRVLAAFLQIVRDVGQVTSPMPPLSSAFPAAFLTAVGEDKPQSTCGLRPRRYISMLRALFERLLDFLSSLPGRHTCELWILQRHLHEDATELITHGDLLAQLQELSMAPRYSIRSERSLNVLFVSGDAEVRLVPWELRFYGQEIGGGFVLADFAANHARGALDRFVPLRASGGVLSALGLLWQGFPIPTHVEGLRGGLVAALPHCREGLEQAHRESWDASELASYLAAHREARLRPWAIEQALEWRPDAPAGSDDGPEVF